MRKLTSIVATLLAVAGLAVAQSNSGTLVATVPQATNLFVTTTGTPGTSSVCYWVIAVYTGGKSAPYGPVCITNSPGTLSSTNFNVVNFTAPASTISAPTGYDIVRTATATPPSGSLAGGSTLLISGSVATAQSASPVNDQSNTTSGYTIATQTAVAYSVLDTVSAAVPQISTYTSINGAAPVLTNSTLNNVSSVEGSLTVAQLATGSIIVPGQTGHTIKLLGAAIQVVGGTVATCTNIDFGDSAFANPKFRFLSAGTLAVNVTYSDGSAAAFVTTGTTTALNAAFGSGLGIGLQSNGGGTCTGATSIIYRVYYRVL